MSPGCLLSLQYLNCPLFAFVFSGFQHSCIKMHLFAPPCPVWNSLNLGVVSCQLRDWVLCPPPGAVVKTQPFECVPMSPPCPPSKAHAACVESSASGLCARAPHSRTLSPTFVRPLSPLHPAPPQAPPALPTSHTSRTGASWHLAVFGGRCPNESPRTRETLSMAPSKGAPPTPPPPSPS